MVFAYRWTRNDVKSSKMYMSILAGIENLDINAKMRLTNARVVAFWPKRNLIQCMGDMALMPQKKVKNSQFLVIFMIFGTFGAPKGPYILLQMPYE